MNCINSHSQQAFVNKFFREESFSKIALVNKKSLNHLFKEKLIKESSFVSLDLSTISYQKLTSYFEKGRLVLLSFDEEKKIKKVYHTQNSPIQAAELSKDSKFELLEDFEYLELFGYCLEKLGQEAIDLPVQVELPKEEKKSFNLFKKVFQARKVEKINLMILQMLMKFNETVHQIIKNMFEVDEEERVQRKKEENRKEVLRAHILYEIRQKAMLEKEIQKKELLHKELRSL